MPMHQNIVKLMFGYFVKKVCYVNFREVFTIKSSTQIRARTQGRQFPSLYPPWLRRFRLNTHFYQLLNRLSEPNCFGTRRFLTTCPLQTCIRHRPISNRTGENAVLRTKGDLIVTSSNWFTPFTVEREVARSRSWHFWDAILHLNRLSPISML